MEQMCYHWVGAPADGGMFACFPARTILDLQTELLKLQQALAERVGEPVLLGIRLVYDDWFEVEVRTFTDRFGTAAGRDLERAVEEAAVMLLELDQVVAELRPAQG